MSWALRLVEDRLAAGEDWPAGVGSVNRIAYVLAGELAVGAAPDVRRVGAGHARHDATGISGRAGTAGAHVLRFELIRDGAPAAGGGTLVLEHPLHLDDTAAWLMRCDRVDFEPGGVALPHGHRGGGIRRLLRGQLEVTVGDGAPRVMRSGDAWFESGQEPVLAVAAADAETSFVRVSVLPAELRGRSSIVYVNADDAARSRPRTYTVHVDEPIALR